MLRDSAETALNSSTDVLFTATACMAQNAAETSRYSRQPLWPEYYSRRYAVAKLQNLPARYKLHTSGIIGTENPMPPLLAAQSDHR